MKPLLLVLDDWEGRIQASACWSQVEELVEIKFVREPIESINDTELEQAQFLMALRERTTLNEQVFKRMPNLKLILQTGGHAYHIDTSAAKKKTLLLL
jgi:phosphoglycerate dehydrogenase-like enzyme